MNSKYELVLNGEKTGTEYRRPDGTIVTDLSAELNRLHEEAAALRASDRIRSENYGRLRRRINFVKEKCADVCHVSEAESLDTEAPAGWSCGYYAAVPGGDPDLHLTEGHETWEAAVDAAMASETEGKVS